MRRLPSILFVSVLLLLLPGHALAQESEGSVAGDAVLTAEDVAFLRELTRQERAAIERDRALVQEALDDPATIAVWTGRGPVVVPLRRLPAILQMVWAGRGEGDAVTLEELALWLAIDTRVELLPDLQSLTAGQARDLRDITLAADAAAERKLDELYDLARAAERFEAWLGEQPVAAGTEVDTAGASEAGVEATHENDDGIFAAEGPFEGQCVFSTGYLLRQDLYPVTQVVAWRDSDFDPSRARYSYAAAEPDEDAEDPNHRIERMRASVADDEDATVVFDGSFSGFCAWAAATCPNVEPKQGGSAVCSDGAPVYE